MDSKQILHWPSSSYAGNDVNFSFLKKCIIHKQPNLYMKPRCLKGNVLKTKFTLIHHHHIAIIYLIRNSYILIAIPPAYICAVSQNKCTGKTDQDLIPYNTGFLNR